MDIEAASTVRNDPCGRCGYPLGPHRVWDYVREDFDPHVIAAVLDGSINKIVCRRCGFSGWITKPMLWIDRQRQRAVFVQGDTLPLHEIDLERERLLALALADVPAPDKPQILRRLQEARYHQEIPHALAVSDEDAEVERLAREAWKRRAHMPLAQRLERIVEDAKELGVFMFDVDEPTPDFLRVAESAVANLALDDNSPRASILRKILQQLTLIVGRKEKGAAESAPTLPPNDHPILGDDPERIADLAEKIFRHEWRGAAPGLEEGPSWSEEPLSSSRQEEPDVDEMGGIAFDMHAPKHERASALHSIAVNHLRGKRWHDALNASSEMIRLAGDLEDENLLVLGLSFAGIASSGNRHPVAALRYLSDAVNAGGRLAERLGGTIPHDVAGVIPIVYETMGDVHHALGNLPHARELYLHSSTVFKLFGRADGVRNTLRRAGIISLELGDLPAASEQFQKVVDLCENRDRERAEALINLAWVMGRLAGVPELTLEMGIPRKRDDEDADTPSAEAVPKADVEDEMPLPPPPPNVEGNRVRLVVYQIDENGDRQAFMEAIYGDEALDRLHEARSIARELNDHRLEIQTFTQLTSLYETYGLHLAARDAATLTVNRATKLGVRLEPTTYFAMANAWQRIAETAWNAEQKDQARHAWTEALRSLDTGMEALSNTYQVIQIDLQARLQRGLLLEVLGRREEAAAVYRDVQARFEGYRQHMGDETHKRNIQELVNIVHPRAARNAIALWREQPNRVELVEEAFHYSEAGRSRILLDILHSPSSSAPERAVLEKLPRPQTVEDIVAAIPKDTAVLLYSLVPTYFHCVGSWIVYAIFPIEGLCHEVVQSSLDAVFAAQKALNEIMEKSHERLVTVTDQGDPAAIEAALRELEAERATVDRLLEELGTLLLPASLMNRLIERGVRKLVFVPEGYLFGVPFSALRVECGNGMQYLIGDPSTSEAQFEVIVMPSASAYLATCDESVRENVPLASLLGISDPQRNLDGATQWFEREIVPAWSSGHVLHVAGLQATTERALAAMRGAGMVVYYGHGHYDAQDALDSGLILSNAVLSARRLLESDARSLLEDCHTFVLLACSGGRVDAEAEWRAGEQLGLPIALHLAGVRNVVGALWPLWAHAAEVFGLTFVKQLARGATVGDAYRKGIHAMMTADGFWSHPLFWAGLRLTGSGETRIMPSKVDVIALRTGDTSCYKTNQGGT